MPQNASPLRLYACEVDSNSLCSHAVGKNNFRQFFKSSQEQKLLQLTVSLPNSQKNETQKVPKALTAVASVDFNYANNTNSTIHASEFPKPSPSTPFPLPLVRGGDQSAETDSCKSEYFLEKYKELHKLIDCSQLNEFLQEDAGVKELPFLVLPKRSVTVPQYGSIKTTVFVWDKNTNVKFVRNTDEPHSAVSCCCSNAVS